ncbi:hypothetical protein P167DRAFT_540372 [Morchella conica CCBAS932]|uniref:Uncharacterized protein n=1 Tax=Morchella conica CCBAS932 TaxID=1392247 RepID=A0A3N4K989_9PEZI|nr:hypothetical protein P167DRAFT_540372 [Morchella conica CCBAS932]
MPTAPRALTLNERSRELPGYAPLARRDRERVPGLVHPPQPRLVHRSIAGARPRGSAVVPC